MGGNLPPTPTPYCYLENPDIYLTYETLLEIAKKTFSFWGI